MARKSKGLRKRIEYNVGQQALEKYCQRDNDDQGPIMIPPIPNSRFIDKLPEGNVLEGLTGTEKGHQDAYEAEVMLYRRLEEIKSRWKVVVLHQLDLTHEQYSAFLSDHLCNKKKCKEGPDEHPCHKRSTEVEGECDFVIVGDNFVVILEVKGLSFIDNEDEDKMKLQSCYDDALRQRKRMKDLIQSIDSSVMIYEFTVFSNLSSQEVSEQYLSDETLLFNDELEDLVWIADWFKTFSCPRNTANGDRNELKRCLLGLWLIDQDNKWDHTKCSLSKCIKDISEKLRRSLVTRKAVEEAQFSGKGRKKNKRYPENSEMIDAPDIFKDYLNIKCLTTEQLDLFQSTDRFLWVEGPAGSGKTIAMLGKIIQLILKEPEKRALIIPSLAYNIDKCKILKNHLESLNNIGQDIIKCGYVSFKCSEWEGYKLNEALRSLSQVKSINNIILLSTGEPTWASNIHHLFNHFDYIFIDDFQQLTDTLRRDTLIYRNVDNTIIIQGLLPIVENRAKNNTLLWILNDCAQVYSFNLPILIEYDEQLKEQIKVLKGFFQVTKHLSVNLRNTYEISTSLSVIRQHLVKAEFFEGTIKETLPPQNVGHLLRGTKPVIYLTESNQVSHFLTEILTKELEKLKIPEDGLANKDIAVQVAGLNINNKDELNVIGTVLSKWNTKDDEIAVVTPVDSMSAEWPAFIPVIRHWSDIEGTIITQLGNTMSFIYQAMSRARVYCSVIIYGYERGKCQFMDELLDELKAERNDVCRINLDYYYST